MFSRNKQAAQEKRGMQEMSETGLAGGPRPVGEPLFAAYRMDAVPDDCDVMTKLRAKFARYEEEDQEMGYVRSFLYLCPGQGSWEAGAAAQPLTNKAKAARAWMPRRAAVGAVKTFHDFLDVWRGLPGIQG